MGCLRTMKKYLCCVALVAVAFLASPGGAKPNGIGKIQNRTEVQGAGCSAWKGTNSSNTIFWTGFEDKTALMNINGKDTKLRLVSESNSNNGRTKKGDRWVSVYRSGKITVKLTRVANRVCKPGDQECESTGYDATIDLQNGKQRETIKANADCGS
jgi:hypothetical protein